MKVIIVDDEQLLVNELKKMISLLDPEIEIVGAYTDSLQALQELPTVQPDAAFLDIELPDLNGVILAEKFHKLDPALKVIFITAYNNYASEAFNVNAVDYLLKPVRPERLQKALQKAGGNSPHAELVDFSQVKIQSFGKFGIYLGEKPVIWSRTKQKELFAYLLHCEDQWVDKYKICEDLWPGCKPDKALANLQTAVWAIRKTLKSERIPNISIEYSNDSYILYLKDILWDVRKYREAYKAYRENGHADAFDDVVDLYKDGYLFYDDWNWAVLDREMYHQRHEKLKRYHMRYQEIE